MTSTLLKFNGYIANWFIHISIRNIQTVNLLLLLLLLYQQPHSPDVFKITSVHWRLMIIMLRRRTTLLTLRSGGDQQPDACAKPVAPQGKVRRSHC